MNAPLILRPSAHAAGDLVNRYQVGSSFFASPTQTLLAGAAALTLPAVAQTSLIARSEALLRTAAQTLAEPMLIGAVPFDLDRPAHLFVPSSVAVAAPITAWPSGTNTGACAGAEGSQCVPTSPIYQGNVAAAIEHIRAGNLQKVVLSRSVNVEAKIDLQALLQCLLCRNLNGYTYALGVNDGRTLIGASPELLISKHGRTVVSRPLAGSIPHAQQAAEDNERARNLLNSAKDRHEHAVVVDAVVAALKPYCSHIHVPETPSLVSTATMWHLGTRIEADLADAAVGSLELALALHPTPAVCGYPRSAARAFINAVEGFERGFFTGLVGWSDAQGDGEWAVTIRCAEVDARSATLYAGAGIVDGSDPALELAETTAKLRTMLGAMGLEHAVALEA